MIFLYVTSFLIALFTVVARRRRPDLFTIAVVASGYYSSTLLFGEVYDPDNHLYVPISPEIYIFYSFLFVSLAGFVFAYDHRVQGRNTYSWRHKDLFIFFFTVIFGLFMLINTLDYRAFFPREIGGDSAASSGIIFSLYWMFSLIYLLASIRARSRFNFILSFIFLLTTLTAGSRAYFTAGLMGIAILLFQSKQPLVITRNPHYILLGLFGFAFLIIFKNVYQYLLMMNADLLLAAAVNWEVILFRLTRGGESVILLNFVHAVDMYSVSRGSFIDLILIKSIPFLSEQVAIATGGGHQTLSDILNDHFYSTVNYGMASSFWGLLYYTAGWFGLLLGGASYCFAIYGLQKLLDSQRLVGLFLMPGAIFLAFYASRLEIGAILYPFYMGIVIFLVYLIGVQILRGAKRKGDLNIMMRN